MKGHMTGVQQTILLLLVDVPEVFQDPNVNNVPEHLGTPRCSGFYGPGSLISPLLVLVDLLMDHSLKKGEWFVCRTRPGATDFGCAP